MIHRATRKDILTIADMAVKLWKNNTIESLMEEYTEIISDDKNVVFLIFVEKRAIGFSQCQLRYDYVEGTKCTPVSYLEGIFIEADYRRRGFAKKLLKKCEEWAKEKGCSEFASDCELDNGSSLAFHLNMGFIEANRIICFTKQL